MLDYSTASISAFYRKDLVGQLGNLISRISAPSLISKLDHPEQISIMPEILGPTDLVLVEKLNNLPGSLFHLLSNGFNQPFGYFIHKSENVLSLC